MAKSKQLPVDVYVRVSRVGGREHMISPEEQERDARAFAVRRGLNVAEVISDIDRSGGTLMAAGHRGYDFAAYRSSFALTFAWGAASLALLALARDTRCRQLA